MPSTREPGNSFGRPTRLTWPGPCRLHSRARTESNTWRSCRAEATPEPRVPAGYMCMRCRRNESKMTMRSAITLIGLGILGLSIPAYGQSRKIVFIAAPKDHGVPGRHEYEKDLRVLAYALEHSSNLQNITTKVYVGKAPAIDELKDSAVIVVHGDGDRSANEHNPIFPANATTDHGK